MTINLNVPATHELKPKISVFGVGGAGGNAVNNMITSHLEGVEFVVANTDAQALAQSLTERHIQLGTMLTQGLGAGARPDVGRQAAEEALESIQDHLQGANMVFITCGMGGGTGTGAAPILAQAARDADILTVGVVTKPFHFEGKHRMRIAEAGIDELQQVVDTLIVIPNQNLFRVANEKTTFADAFKMADDVLYSGVRGVTDLMVMPGLINLDFADVRSVMMEMGKAMMGTGEAEGEKRSLDAAEAAINNPLLDDVSLKGARGVLVNITGGPDMTLFEVDEACNHIRDQVDVEANIIFGSTFDEELAGRVSGFRRGDRNRLRRIVGRRFGRCRASCREWRGAVGGDHRSGVLDRGQGRGAGGDFRSGTDRETTVWADSAGSRPHINRSGPTGARTRDGGGGGAPSECRGSSGRADSNIGSAGAWRPSRIGPFAGCRAG